MTVRTAHRSRTIAAIHVLAAQLGMDTADKSPASDYRAMLWSLARASSCAELDYTALERVRAHLAALARASGIKAKHPPIARAGRPTPAPDRINMVRKIRAMLYSAGRADEYADGLAVKMFHVERYEWCQPDQLRRLIAALTYDQKRRAARDNRDVTTEG